MTMTVNTARSNVTPDGSQLQVIIDGNDMEELLSDSAALATTYARNCGYASVGLRPGAHPYAVDATTDEAIEAPYDGMVTKGFRVEQILGVRS